MRQLSLSCPVSAGCMGALQVQETPEMYSQVTLPYIQSIPESHIQWVYNILARKVRYES